MRHVWRAGREGVGRGGHFSSCFIQSFHSSWEWHKFPSHVPVLLRLNIPQQLQITKILLTCALVLLRLNIPQQLKLTKIPLTCAAALAHTHSHTKDVLISNYLPNWLRKHCNILWHQFWWFSTAGVCSMRARLQHMWLKFHNFRKDAVQLCLVLFVDHVLITIV